MSKAMLDKEQRNFRTVIVKCSILKFKGTDVNYFQWMVFLHYGRIRMRVFIHFYFIFCVGIKWVSVLKINDDLNSLNVYLIFILVLKSNGEEPGHNFKCLLN